MDRVRVWLAVSPVLGASVLVAHALAYRITDTPPGSLHAYLDHAPQVLVVLCVVSASFAALARRLGRPSLWLFPAAAVAVFAAQEHVERIVHTGELSLVVATPAFAVGLVLQLPVALVAWALARWLLTELPEIRRQPRTLPRFHPRLLAPIVSDVAGVPARPLPGRGPPLVGCR